MTNTSHALGTPGIEHASESYEMPATRTGKAAMWCALAFVVGFAVNSGLVGIFGRTEMSDAFRAIMAAWGIALMSAGVIAGILALTAVMRFKERSWAVMMALLPGAFALFFLIGEFAFPH